MKGRGKQAVCSLYLKHTDTTIHSCIKRPIQFHGEWVGALLGVATDTLYHCFQLLHIVHHHLYSILDWIQRGLTQEGGREGGREGGI